MSTITEITNLIIEKSKHEDAIKKATSSETFIDMIAGDANTARQDILEACQMLVALRTELNSENSSRVAITGRNSFSKDFSYTRITDGIDDPYPIMARFLSTVDKTGETFKPLLEKLKVCSAEKLADVIFEEIAPIHRNWLNQMKGADKFFNLQINYVEPSEIESIKELSKFELLSAISNSSWTSLYEPSIYTLHQQWEGVYNKQDLVNQVFRENKYSFDFNAEISDGLFVVGHGEGFFMIGINQDNNFTFKKLENSGPFEGHLLDFNDYNSTKSYLKMVYADSFKELATDKLNSKEAVIFAMKCLKQHADNYDRINNKYMSHEQSRKILESLGSKEKNEYNKMFNFSKNARQAINDFTAQIRNDQLVTGQFGNIIHMLEHFDSKITSEHIDLWTYSEDKSHHSKSVVIINQLVNDYRNKPQERKEQLQVAKSLNNEQLLLLESKLACERINPKRFQEELMQYDKKMLKLK